MDVFTGSIMENLPLAAASSIGDMSCSSLLCAKSFPAPVLDIE